RVPRCGPARERDRGVPDGDGVRPTGVRRAGPLTRAALYARRTIEPRRCHDRAIKSAVSPRPRRQPLRLAAVRRVHGSPQHRARAINRWVDCVEEVATMTSASTAQLFVEFSRAKLVGELWPRLRSCVESLTDEQVWWRPNDASNSIGNLLLHLNGNVRQWIVDSFNATDGGRDRAAEFSE